MDTTIELSDASSVITIDDDSPEVHATKRRSTKSHSTKKFDDTIDLSDSDDEPGADETAFKTAKEFSSRVMEDTWSSKKSNPNQTTAFQTPSSKSFVREVSSASTPAVVPSSDGDSTINESDLSATQLFQDVNDEILNSTIGSNGSSDSTIDNANTTSDTSVYDNATSFDETYASSEVSNTTLENNSLQKQSSISSEENSTLNSSSDESELSTEITATTYENTNTPKGDQSTANATNTTYGENSSLASSSSDQTNALSQTSNEMTDISFETSNLSLEQSKTSFERTDTSFETSNQLLETSNLSLEESKTSFELTDTSFETSNQSLEESKTSFEINSSLELTNTSIETSNQSLELTDTSLDTTADNLSFGSSDEKSNNTSSETSTVRQNGGRQSSTSSGSHSETSTLTDDDDGDEEEEEVISKRFAHQMALPSKRRRIMDPDLPSTCTVLTSNKTGGRVYLVGTAHFSKESQDDVARVIRAVQPDVVVLELCKARINIVHTDEAKVQEEAQNLTTEKMIATLRQNGVVQGTMYLLLLYFSAKLTKELGMAPGGEFRRAFVEARGVPGCLIHLGDRPIEVTLKRAFSTLTCWQKIKFGFSILTYRDSITAEEVEQCKQKDLLESMLGEIAGEFPALSRVFVQERDLYLAHSLRIAVDSQMKFVPDPHGPHHVATTEPPVVVGVVGIGHVAGIVQNWDHIIPSEVDKLMIIPKIGMVERMTYTGIRLVTLGLGAYACYRLAKIPVSFVRSRLF